MRFSVGNQLGRHRRTRGRTLSHRSTLAVHSTTRVAVRTLHLRALPADVPGLSALVASLPSRVRRAAVRSRAVARDVAQLAASVALHGLSLAVASEVVGAAALVARRGAVRLHAGEATTTSATEAAGAATHGCWSCSCRRGRGSPCGVRVRAVALRGKLVKS